MDGGLFALHTVIKAALAGVDALLHAAEQRRCQRCNYAASTYPTFTQPPWARPNAYSHAAACALPPMRLLPVASPPPTLPFHWRYQYFGSPPLAPPQGQALYLAQEYCLTDLSVLLRRASCPPPEGVAKGVMRQLLRGLEALHTEGEGRKGEQESSNASREWGGGGAGVPMEEED